MKFKNYPFDQLPFSELYKTYISEYQRLADFYAANPFDMEALAEHAQNISVPVDRDITVEVLKLFNNRFELHENAIKNIERLQDDHSLALVTGQQLGIFGGPLYTILKTITTIHLSQVLEKALKRPVIPVFWLADEDHDYDEVKQVRLLDRDDVKSYSLEYNHSSHPPVSEIKLNGSFEAFKEDIREGLFETDFTDDLWDLLNECYSSGSRMDNAFGKLIARLFSKHGLILAGSNCTPVKENTKDCMQMAIQKAGVLREALEDQSAALEKDFHRQATIYDSNLFYLDGEAGRTKILHDGNSWKTDSGKKWSTNELVNLIDQKPQQFSPNVFLRPIMQDELIPTLGYIAGPGELAYYGQMKSMYDLFDRSMPAIIPRLSATLIEPAIDRILHELPFEVGDYGNRIEDLESSYVDQTESHDIEAIFNEWKQKVKEISEAHKSEIKEIDPTLEGAAGKATAVYFGELDKLKGKVYRTVKQKDETQLKRIRKIKANLFPDDILQERVISFIYFMNKYGIDIWDELLGALDEDEQFDQHKLIYL